MSYEVLHDARCWVLRDRYSFDKSFDLLGVNLSSGPFFRWHIAYAKERYRPYFENYTVDASILYSSLYGLLY